jgi:hypothetical protein
LAARFSEDPLLRLRSAFLKQAPLRRPVCATADSRARLGRRRDSHCPESQSPMRRSRPAGPFRNPANGPERPQRPARQYHGPDHGDAEQDVTDHEQDRRQPIDDHHRQVLVMGPAPAATVWPRPTRGTEFACHCNQIGASQSALPGPTGIKIKASRKWAPVRYDIQGTAVQG